jgi:hypothetical protein
MRRLARRPFVVAALAIPLAVIGTSVAYATLHAAAHDGILSKQTLRMAVKNGVPSQSDVGPPGPSAGDTFFDQADLYNLAGTHKVGSFATVCVLANTSTSLNHCVGTAFLGGGKVEISGSAFFTETAHVLSFSVVGGTATYDNVVGQATLRFRPENLGDLLTLRLIPSFRHP